MGERFVEKSRGDFFLAFEVMVKGPFGNGGGGEDVFERCSAVAVSAEKVARSSQDTQAGLSSISCHEER